MYVIFCNTCFVQKLLDRQAHTNWEIRAAFFMDTRYDFGNKTQTIFKAAAVFISTLVGIRA